MAARPACAGSSTATPSGSPSRARRPRPGGVRAGDRRCAARARSPGAAARRAAATPGFVRQCHGDLHLRNIVLLDGRPTLFDGVEFNDEIACIDVLYDLAFLLMDLWRRGLPQHANASGTATWPRPAISTARRCCRCSCRAARRSGPRPARPRRSLQTDAQRRRSCRRSRASTSRWRSAAAAAARRASSRSAACRDRASPRWRWRSRRRSAPCPAPSCSAATRSGNNSSAWPLGEHLGPEGYAPEVSTRVYAHWPSGPAASSAVATAPSSTPCTRDRERDAIERVAATAGVPFAGSGSMRPHRR